MPWPLSISTPAARLVTARLVRVTEPTVEPVTAAEAKLWLRVDDSADDAIFSELIALARGTFEDLTGRTLVSTTYRAEWDARPRAGIYVGASIARDLELPRGPLAASSPVAWIKYTDENGTAQTLSSADYTVDTGRDPGCYGRVRLAPGADWPALGDYPGALRCQFTAGYGSATSDVPAAIKVALKLFVAHLYQNRTPVNIGNIVNEIPLSLQALIDMHRIRSVA